MSGVGEIVGIIACVAGVISAYRDGGAIIQRIKVKRARNRAPPPPRLLEESIDQAPEEIEKEKQRGIARFGKAFAEGDHIAVIALQQVTIQLQGSLLERLRHAAFDDEVTDFTYLVDAADLGRDRTVAVLLELRQRLLQAATITEVPVSSPQETQMSLLGQTFPPVQTPEPKLRLTHEAPPVSTRPQPQRSWSREHSFLRDRAVADDATAGADSVQNQPRRQRHSSLLGIFKHRSYSGSNDQHNDDRRRLSASATTLPFRTFKPREFQDDTSSDRSGRTETPGFTYQEGEDNPFEIWGSKARQDTPQRDTLSVPAEGSTPNPPLSPTNMTRTLSSTPTTVQTLPGGNAVPNPNPDNNYLGFCKGAVKLQNGDRKAMTKSKEFNDGWSSSSVYFLACSSSKCAFAGHMNVDMIWTKVWNMKQSQGVKFRWSFLAKSHVSQSKVKDHQFMYQCLFCVFLGQETPVIHGTDLYLDHVIQEHRGRLLGDVVLYKVGCVNDRVCGDGEEFDINLFPLSEQEYAPVRKQSEVLSDDLLMGVTKRSSEAQDSMFSNEPWNQGLSEFHYGGELLNTQSVGETLIGPR